jgi:ABC-type phosphate transport system substrate-binding protein
MKIKNEIKKHENITKWKWIKQRNTKRKKNNWIKDRKITTTIINRIKKIEYNITYFYFYFYTSRNFLILKKNTFTTVF